MTAFTTTLSEYPDTPFREEAMYLKTKAAFKLAENSVRIYRKIGSEKRILL